MNCTKCDELRAELERMKRLAKESCETELAIEKLCASVLGQAFVDGDSTCVPGPEACVAEVVKRLERAQSAVRSELELIPQEHKVTVRENSGVENIFASLVVSCAKMVINLKCVKAELGITRDALRDEQSAARADREAVESLRAALERVKIQSAARLEKAEGDLDTAKDAIRETLRTNKIGWLLESVLYDMNMEIADAQGIAGELGSERDRLKAELEILRRELAESRNQVAELLGWSTGQPPKFVSMADFERVKAELERVKVELAEGVQIMSELIPAHEAAQIREAAMRDALEQINELRFYSHGVHDRFAHALELSENALAQAKALGLE